MIALFFMPLIKYGRIDFVRNKGMFMRIVCVALATLMLFGAVPASALQGEPIDAPLTGPVGSGWDDFGPSPSEIVFESTPSEPPYVPDLGPPDGGSPGSGGGSSGNGMEDDRAPIEEDNNDDYTSDNENEIADKEDVDEVSEADEGVFVLPISPETEAAFITWMEAVGRVIASPVPRNIAPLTSGAARVDWDWSGGSVGVTTPSGWEVRDVPRIWFVSGAETHSEPICAAFGPDPGRNVDYTASPHSNERILQLMIQFNQGGASRAATQMAIWSITNDAGFREWGPAASAWSSSQSINTSGWSLYRWTAGSGHQPLFTVAQVLFCAKNEEQGGKSRRDK